MHRGYRLRNGGYMKKRILLVEEEHSEEDVYAEETREVMLEDDEISPAEEAFMNGYEEAA